MYLSIEANPESPLSSYLNLCSLHTQPGGRIEISDSGAGRPVIELYTDEHTRVARVYALPGKLAVWSLGTDLLVRRRSARGVQEQTPCRTASEEAREN